MPDAAETVAQIRRLNRQLERRQEAIAALSAEREELVRSLRAAGWSFGKIATETGMTRARVAQICG
jgi:DNA-directed RNA polymerase specialized sigma24 family protein